MRNKETRCAAFTIVMGLLLALHVTTVASYGGDAVQTATLDMKPQTNFVLFSAEANGAQVTAGIDSGAYTSFISTELANQLKLKGNETTITLKLGEVTVENFPVSVRDFRKSILNSFLKAGVNVVLGHNFLTKVLTVFDYPKRKVSFFSTPTSQGYDAIKETVDKATGASENGVVLNITFFDNHTLVCGKVNGKFENVYFCVDTGSYDPSNILSQGGLDLLKCGMRTTLDLEVNGYVFKQLAFAKCPPCDLDKVSANFQRDKKMCMAGILGYPFFKDYKVIFDYPDKKLIFVPAK